MFNILKLLLAIIGVSFLAEVSFGQGDAPAILKGLNQADKSIGAFIRTPNGQVTKISSSSALIETGNNNILENPNFEHSVYDTSWIVGSGTSSKIDVNADSTKVFSGLNALKMTMAASSLNVFNVSPTGNQAFKDGVQGLVSVRIKTTVSDIRVCQRKGFAVTTNCVNVTADGKWNLYKVPSILGEFYNGVEVTSLPTAVTGDVYIDDAFVGAVDLKQDVPLQAIQSMVGSTGAVAAAAAFKPTINSSKGSGLFSYNIATGDFSILKASMISLSLQCDASAGVVCAPQWVKNGVLSKGYQVSENGTGQPATVNWVTYADIGDSFRATLIFGGASAAQVEVTATEYVNTSVYSSPVTINADKIGEIIHTTNSTAPQGFISALNKSIGQAGSGATFTGQTYYALYEHLWSIAGLTTTAGDVYRISSAKGASASADFAANKTITIDYETNAPFIRGKAAAASLGAYQGSAVPNISGNIGRIPDATGDGAFLVGAATGFQKGSSGAAQSTVNFDASRSSSVYQAVTEARPKNVSLNIFIRFAGDTQLITGSFNGLQSCTDTLACTDTFSATVSAAGVVSGENVDWINGFATVSDTSQYVFDFKAGIFTVPPTCFAQTWQGTDVAQITSSASPATSTQLTTRTGYQIAGGAYVKNPYDHRIICQKQGADYIGKTAMAVASDQNVRSIGSTNVDIQSVYFGSGANCASACTTGTCTICNQVGSKITTVSFVSTGLYNVNGIDGTKYNCVSTGAIDPTGAAIAMAHNRSSSTSTYARIAATTSGAVLANVLQTSVNCMGIP